MHTWSSVSCSIWVWSIGRSTYLMKTTKSVCICSCWCVLLPILIMLLMFRITVRKGKLPSKARCSRELVLLAMAISILISMIYSNLISQNFAKRTHYRTRSTWWTNPSSPPFLPCLHPLLPLPLLLLLLCPMLLVPWVPSCSWQPCPFTATPWCSPNTKSS